MRKLRVFVMLLAAVGPFLTGCDGKKTVPDSAPTASQTPKDELPPPPPPVQ